MTPTEKDPEIDAMITTYMGKDRQKVIREGRGCMTCEKPDLNFKDALSHTEYCISGMCQTCQDKVFGGENEEDS